jgi:hypothetical protein
VGGTSDGLWFLNFLSSGGQRMNFEVYKDSLATPASISTPVLSLNDWHHVVVWHRNGVEIGCVIDNGAESVLAYVDGIDPNVTAQFRFKSFNALGASAPIVDEIAIWKGLVLNPSQIASDWNLGNGTTFP